MKNNNSNLNPKYPIFFYSAPQLYNNYGMGGAGSYNMPMGGMLGMMPPMLGSPMGIYNNYGSGCA